MNEYSVVQIYIKKYFVGTGFVIGQEFVFTAYHVISNRQEADIQVKIPEKNVVFPVKIWYFDNLLDIAILKITNKKSNLLDSLQLKEIISGESQNVKIVGYPKISRGKKITLNGVISGLPTHQKFHTDDFVPSQQLSISEKMNYEGMSGSPVFLNDAVIGIFRWQLKEQKNLLNENSTGITFCTLISDFFTKNPNLRSQFNAHLVFNTTNTTKTKVINLLKMLGYNKIEQNVNYKGITVPILATVQNSLTSHSVVVGFAKEHINILKKCSEECKAIFILMEDLNIDKKISSIQIKRYQDLLNDIVDFSTYIDTLINDYEHYETYVSDTGKLIRTPIIDDLITCNLHKHFVVDNLSCMPIHKKGIGKQQSLIQYVENWLNKPNQYHLSILGDYGVGKTSFSLYLTYILALRYKNDPVNNRIPLFIPLKKYKEGNDWKKFIVELLRDQYGIQIENVYEFQKLLESGRLVLIMDGFDETVKKTNKQKTIQTFERLTKLMVSNSKIILTCRTHFFTNRAHVNKTFGQHTDDDNELLKMIRQKPNFEVIQMEEFNDEQIIKILKKRKPTNWQFAWATIRRIYNLKDLARRAILLDMIVKTLSTLQNGEDAISPVDIYKLYTDFWIKREDWRSVMTPEGKKAFMEELATLMWERNEQSINYRDLRKPINDHFRHNVNVEEDLDYFEHDARTCSFLRRDADGNYSFVHKSFYEFFVASKLAKEINKGHPSHLNARLTSLEIRAFLQQMIDSVDKLIEIVENTMGKTFEDVGYSGSTAATIAVSMDAESFKKKNLDRSCLREVDFSGANLTETSFRDADLQGSLFFGVSLDFANLSEANLRGAQFIGITAFRTADFNPDGRFLVSGGDSGSLVFWNTATWEKDFVLQGNNVCVLSTRWDPKGDLVANASENGEISIWKIDSRELLTVLKGQQGPVYTVCWNLQGTLLASAGDDGKIRIWDTNTWKIQKTLAGDSVVLGIDWSPDGRWLASTYVDGSIRIWKTQNWTSLQLLGHKDYVRSVKWSPSGDSFASCGDDGYIKLWSKKGNSWSVLNVLNLKTPILSIAWHPQIPLLAGGMRDDSIIFWNILENNKRSFKGHTGRVWDIAWSPDGQILASAGNEGATRVWNVSSEIENNRVNFSPNFGNCLGVLETRFSCIGAKIKNAKGLDETGYQIVRHKDWPWKFKNGSLQDWLLSRGATLE